MPEKSNYTLDQIAAFNKNSHFRAWCWDTKYNEGFEATVVHVYPDGSAAVIREGDSLPGVADNFEVIKPKQREPYTFDDREQFRESWVRIKGYTTERRITAISDIRIILTDSGCGYTYAEAFDMLEHLDGTPFGKIVNQPKRGR